MWIITDGKQKFLSNEGKFVSFKEFEAFRIFTAYLTAVECVAKHHQNCEVVTLKFFINLLIAYHTSDGDERLFKELRDEIERLEIQVEELTKLNLNLINNTKKKPRSITGRGGVNSN